MSVFPLKHRTLLGLGLRIGLHVLATACIDNQIVYRSFPRNDARAMRRAAGIFIYRDLASFSFPLGNGPAVHASPFFSRTLSQ